MTASKVSLTDKKTSPPKRFTEGSLIAAMVGISNFVQNPTVKKVLRDNEGIGTEATRAKIIETLIERNFIARQKRQVISTATGRALIRALPDVATTPDMTALWETGMKRIAGGEMPLDTFLAGVLQQLSELVTRGRGHGSLAIPGARPCSAPGCKGFLRRRMSPKGAFLACTRYPDCKHTAPDAAPPTRPPSGTAKTAKPPAVRKPRVAAARR